MQARQWGHTPNSPQWIEYSSAGGTATQHRLILYRWEIWTLFQWGKERGHRHYHTRGLQPTGGPNVPAKTHSIAVFVLLDELREGCHCTLWELCAVRKAYIRINRTKAAITITLKWTVKKVTMMFHLRISWVIKACWNTEALSKWQRTWTGLPLSSRGQPSRTFNSEAIPT